MRIPIRRGKERERKGERNSSDTILKREKNSRRGAFAPAREGGREDSPHGCYAETILRWYAVPRTRPLPLEGEEEARDGGG